MKGPEIRRSPVRSWQRVLTREVLQRKRKWTAGVVRLGTSLLAPNLKTAEADDAVNVEKNRGTGGVLVRCTVYEV